jgi:anti-sigma28 factor (negative regulator of flagellin synthesis)
MQITNNLQSNSIELGQSTAKPCSPSQRQSPQDQVSISSLASQVASDPSKLSQLQAAYESGTYNVSPQQIANSLINNAMLG